MSNFRILVINNSPEAATEINSLMKNSGINVRVLFASTQHDIDSIGIDKTPDIVIVQQADESDISLSMIQEYCQGLAHVSSFIRCSTDEPDVIKRALEAGITGFLDINRDEQTSRVLKRELANRGASSELKQHQQVLSDIEDRYKLLLESSRDPVAYIHEGFHIYANPAYLDCFAIDSFEELEGTSILELISLDKNEGDFRKLLKRVNNGNLPEHEVQATCNHNEMAIDLEFLTARYKGEPCIQLWVHERKVDNEMLEELEHLRSHDSLTGLLNRVDFLGKLEQATTSKNFDNNVSGLMLAEADQIAGLSEDLGALGTDALLKEMAGIIRNTSGEEAICCRYRDSTFAILLQAPGKPEFEKLAEKLLKNCRTHVFNLGKHTITATCSIGLTYIGQMQFDSDQLIQHCTTALQSAQAEGGDRFSRYRPQLTTVNGADDEDQWGERIRYAINHSRENMLIIQQAIVDVAEPEQDLFIEAFTYILEGKEEIAPEIYMPEAEKHQLGIEIDRAILPEILGMIAHPESATEVSTYFYNLSQGSVNDSSFPVWLRQQLEATGADSSRLVLQLSGKAISKNLRPAQSLLTTLATLECKFSIAEFNHETRLLAALQHLPVSFLKLEPELTQKLSSDPKVSTQIEQIVQQAKAHKIQVIASEVQSARELSTIWSTGVELVQGDYLKHKSRVAGQ